jgi:hypothetical protein
LVKFSSVIGCRALRAAASRSPLNPDLVVKTCTGFAEGEQVVVVFSLAGERLVIVAGEQLVVWLCA